MDIPRSVPSAMVNANGLSPDVVQSTSTCPRVDITSSVIANSVQTHHSAMVLISTCSNGLPKIIEDSGVSLTCAPGGHAWATGCSLSTSEAHSSRIASL